MANIIFRGLEKEDPENKNLVKKSDRWWERIFKKSQMSMFAGDNDTKALPSTKKAPVIKFKDLPADEKPLVGQIKQENGKSYIFLETTIGAPRWHSHEEANKLNEEGKLTPASHEAFMKESVKGLQSGRSGLIGKLGTEKTDDYSKLTSKEALALAKELGKKAAATGIKVAFDDKELLKLYDSKESIGADLGQAWNAGWVEARNKSMEEKPKISFADRIQSKIDKVNGRKKESEPTNEQKKPDKLSEVIHKKIAEKNKKERTKVIQPYDQSGDLFSSAEAAPQLSGTHERKEMPQINTEDFRKLPGLFGKYNIAFEDGMAKIGDLKPSQKDIVEDKLKTRTEIDLKTMKPIAISKDNYIVDGHHRWIKAKNQYGADAEVPILRLMYPRDEAIQKYAEMSKAVQDEKGNIEFGVSADIVGLQKKREEWNRQAIKILEKPDDLITDEDKKILAKYSGDGGTTENSLNEFYTSKEVTAWQWKMMKKFGFKGGNILEPSVGTGPYVHTKPEDTLITGVEISPVSSRIAQILHPHDDIRNEPFEQFVVDNEGGDFDGFIGNIPFGTRGASKAIDEPNMSTHEEYFLSKLFDQIHGGDIGSVIVPTGVMDNRGNRSLRDRICNHAQFLGAYRLPNTAFKHSGTSVTTDVIFFRKHPKNVEREIDVLNETAEGMKVLNDSGIYDKAFIEGHYFDENESHMLGTKDTGNWGRTIVKGKLTNEQLEAALNEEPTKPLDYSKITENAQVNERELQVGDTISRNGHLYRLNENHRWERADIIDEEARQKKIHTAYQEFGIASPEEMQQELKDISTRSKFNHRQREVVEDYLSVAGHTELPELDTLRSIYDNAIKYSKDGETEAEQDKIYLASVLGDEVDRLKKLLDTGNEPDFRRFEQLILLINEYKEKYGNPYTDKMLIKNALENRAVSYFTGAFKENGELSDLLRSPESFIMRPEAKKEYDVASLPSILRYFENNNIEGTLDKIAHFYSGAAGKSDEDLEAVLLADPAVGYDNGKYVPIDRLTTGSVYDKLDRWKQAIEDVLKGEDPHAEMKAAKYQSQTDQLKGRSNYRKVEDMPIEFSSRWIPLEYLNQFLGKFGMKELLWDVDRNQYDVDFSSEGKSPMFGKNGNMFGDLINIINGKGLEHGSQNKDRLANLMEFQEKYKSFIAVHKDRATIEDTFNRKFNNYVNETFDDTPIKINKMKEGFDLNRYHYSAIRRLLAKGRGILAYGTGLGKTFAGIAIAFLQKQTGQAKKPMVVVPKAVLANWASEISKFVGDKEAKVMVIGAHEKKDKFGVTMRKEDGSIIMQDDSFEDVQKKFQLVAQNDYDIILCTYEKMKTLQLDDATQKKYFDDIMDRHIRKSNADDEDVKEGQQALEEAAGVTRTTTKKKRGHNEMDTAETLLGDLTVRQTRGSAIVEHINFEQLGIDSLIVDEAHNFKNLFGLIGRQQGLIGGMVQPNTQRSMRMYMLSRYIREKNNGKNITLLTATPTVNNPLEVFNMLQFIAPEEMDKRNIFNMDEFFQVFGNQESKPYLRGNNEIVDRDTLTGFKTLPELRQLMHEYTDMRSAEDVGLKVPSANEENVLSPKTELQAKVYAGLREQANTYLKLTPKERIAAGYGPGDYMMILSDMQKATISLRMLASSGSRFAPREFLTPEQIEKQGITPKMQQCIDKSLQTFNAGEKKLIFCEYKAAQEELRQHLITAGIPSSKIAVVNATTAGASSKRQKISEDYNAGKYSIIIGNKTMSEGMNFQVETAEIDNLDLPYTPSALVQRVGRGVRQGNKKESVRVNYYLTNGTYDAALNAIIQRKKNWQRDLWKSDSDTAINEGAGLSLTPEEQAILMSDDPDAARLIVEENKKTAVKRQIAQKKSQALSTFNQMQNVMAQYKTLTAKDRETPEGKSLLERIEAAKSSLLKNQHFENKDILESPEPAYVDSDKNVLIPSGHFFSDDTGDWKKGGLYKFISVDPVNRRVTVQKIADGDDEQSSTNLGVPTDPGETKTVDYKGFREYFKEGPKSINVPREDVHNHVIEHIKGMSSVMILDPETISNRKEEITKKLIESIKERSNRYETQMLPIIDKETGEVKMSYTDVTPENIYLPIDPIRWRNDILIPALREEEALRKFNKEWPTGGRHKWRPEPPKHSFANLAKDLYGYYWTRNLPADFRATLKKKKVEIPDQVKNEEEEL